MLSHCETDLHILLRRAEVRAQFFGRKPLVIAGGMRILTFVDRMLQRLFLLRAAPQLQEHMRHGEAVLYCAGIVFGDGERVGVAGKLD